MLEKFSKPTEPQRQSPDREDARNEEARRELRSEEREDTEPRNEDHKNLTTSDLAGAGRVEEPGTEAEVTIAEAYDLPSEPEPPQRPGITPVVKTPAAAVRSGRAPEGVPARGGTAAAAAPAPAKEQVSPLFSQGETKEFRARWDAIQVGFVDEPRRSVEQADNLVAETMKRLAEIFADERGRMEHDWDRGADVSTEDLRVVLQRYRSFFGRLLSM